MKKFINRPKLAVIGIIIAYLAITLAAVLSTKHILYNLEPYPDGILYAISARNFALGRGLKLVYSGFELPLWVPPLYSVVLIPGYLIANDPWIFYLTNCLLGVLTLIVLYHVAKNFTNSSRGGVGAMIIYLAHAVILWLPSVPMTENLTVLLLTSCLYGFSVVKPRRWQVVLSVFSILGLAATRFAAFPVTLSLLVLYLAKLFVDQRKVFYIAVAAVTAAIVLLELLGVPVLTKFPSLLNSLFQSPEFYNTSNIVPSLNAYSESLLGISGRFLWLNIALTSAFVSLPALGFGAYLLFKGAVSEKWKASSLLVAFLAQFPLLLIFYTADSRYLILTIPIISILLAWAVLRFASIKPRGVVLTFAFLLVLHLLTQVSLLKEIASNNLLHRSTAWQYESIKHFDSYFFGAGRDEYLITSLPPHLVEAYQQQQYTLLPLSQYQEFLQKGESVWGSEYQQNNLTEAYTQLLTSGKSVFITNAYITHQQAVIDDYEEYKKHFHLELVSEGCLGACNIYRVELLPETVDVP